MSDTPTIGELYKAKAVSDDRVNAAVDIFLQKPETRHFVIADGYVLDLAAAVMGHPPSAKVVADPAARDPFRRAMIRMAILLARPVKVGGVDPIGI